MNSRQRRRRGERLPHGHETSPVHEVLTESECLAVQVAAARVQAGSDPGAYITGRLLAIITRLAAEVLAARRGGTWQHGERQLPLRAGPAAAELRATVGHNDRSLNIPFGSGH